MFFFELYAFIILTSTLVLGTFSTCHRHQVRKYFQYRVNSYCHRQKILIADCALRFCYLNQSSPLTDRIKKLELSMLLINLATCAFNLVLKKLSKKNWCVIGIFIITITAFLRKTQNLYEIWDNIFPVV